MRDEPSAARCAACAGADNRRDFLKQAAFMISSAQIAGSSRYRLRV
jgi:hypothetical protein